MRKRTHSSWRAHFAGRFGGPVALRGLVSGISPLTATVGAHAGTMQNYIVLYSASAVPADASASMAKAGGSLVYSYPQIGVAIARSDSGTFQANIVKDNRVEGASATAAFATKLNDDKATSADASGPPPGDFPTAPATDADSLSPLQWDMRQIHTPEAHAITGGSPSVLAGDIDTGIDFNHPDLRANIDVANSANCVSGAPVAGLAAQDHNGHGTHTAGTIAAASNGFGIVGVAPNVHIAAVKAGDAAGFFFPESVVCAFMWVATHHVGVTKLTAPGGDSIFGRTPEAPNGRVLSTYPPNLPCTRSVKEPSTDPSEPTVVYCYLQGTSMAAPHVAGVAALIISRYGDLSSP